MALTMSDNGPVSAAVMHTTFPTFRSKRCPCMIQMRSSWERRDLTRSQDERRLALLPEQGYPCSATTGFCNVPIPSIKMRTTSPGRRKRGGLRVNPTPDGVPVAITSPGSSVKICDI